MLGRGKFFKLEKHTGHGYLEFYIPFLLSIQMMVSNVSILLISECAQHMYTGMKNWINQQENKSLKAAMAFIIICMAALFIYVRDKVSQEVV